MPDALRFARPMLRRDQRPGDPDYYDVSFSGLKTAVLNAVKQRRGTGEPVGATRGAIARAFQDALVDTLVEKTARAAGSSTRGASCSAAAWRATRALVAAMRERLGARAVSGVCAVAAPRDGQRRDDRARGAVSPRARRAVRARPQRIRRSAHSRTPRRMTLASCADHPPSVQLLGRSGSLLTGFGIAVLLAFLIAQIVCRARARPARPRRRSRGDERRLVRRAHRHADRRQALLRASS